MGKARLIPSIELVRQFHEAFNHPIAERPTEGSEALRRLRATLVLEEALEFAEACGYEVTLSLSGKPVLSTSPTTRHDLVAMADALGDLEYVVQGANLAFGLPSRTIFEEIHRSNMSKLGHDGKPIYRDDGKVLKSTRYTPPALEPIILLAASQESPGD
jgi:predicted HAD superfamily Cof-like phosphohydrolase